MLRDSDILTTGLTQGYTGKTEITPVSRGNFKLNSSSYNGEDGTYIDQWFNASTGGGQEIGKSSDGTVWTRLYAGGVSSSETLSQVGVSEHEIITFLMGTINNLGPKTRLNESCIPVAEGEWQYRYEITDILPDVNLVTALETIHYKGTLVFAHGIMVCEVRNII